MSNVAGAPPVAAPAAPSAEAPPSPPRLTDAQRQNRWYAPDRALIDRTIPVRSDADKRQYKLVADLVGSRLYVLDKQTNEPVDAYLISPGTSKHPTPVRQWTISKVMPMAWWNPPNSDWARGEKPAPPGLKNPMGVLKLNMGAHGIYIHGTLPHNYRNLGRPASHGCLRMSNGNVIDLYRNYATVGTVITTSNNRLQSAALKSQFAAAGGVVHDIRDGEEYVQPLVEAWSR